MQLFIELNDRPSELARGQSFIAMCLSLYLWNAFKKVGPLLSFICLFALATINCVNMPVGSSPLTEII
jgi:hypothetical protein